MDILRAEIDAKSNVDDYELAYKAIEDGLEWGDEAPLYSRDKFSLIKLNMPTTEEW